MVFLTFLNFPRSSNIHSEKLLGCRCFLFPLRVYLQLLCASHSGFYQRGVITMPTLFAVAAVPFPLGRSYCVLVCLQLSPSSFSPFSSSSSPPGSWRPPRLLSPVQPRLPRRVKQARQIDYKTVGGGNRGDGGVCGGVGRDNLNLLWVKNDDGEAVCSQREPAVSE